MQSNCVPEKPQSEKDRNLESKVLNTIHSTDPRQAELSKGKGTKSVGSGCPCQVTEIFLLIKSFKH